jgi:hypothetical protein
MANGELVDSKTKEQISRCIESTNKPLRPKKKQGFPQTKSPGFVYLIQSEHGECKIGKTHDLSARLHNFHIKLPFRTELIHSIKTDDNISLERELHTRFNAKRINGEWFSLTQEDIDYIKNL